MKAIASFIMQGGRQATIVAALMAIASIIAPPLVVLSTATVCLVTLRNGFSEGARVVVGASVGTALLGYILIGTPFVALSYLVILWLPALLGSYVLRQTRELAKAIELFVVFGMVAVIGIYGFVDNPAEQWALAISNVVENLNQQEDLPVVKEDLLMGVEILSHYITGAVVAGSVISLTLSLYLGRWWQGLLYNPGGFYGEFKQLNLLKRDGLLFVGLLAAAMLFEGSVSEIAWNLNLQILMLFLMIGMSVVHVIAKSGSKSNYRLIAVYVVIFFVPHLMILIVLIGLSDVWMNWRKRLTKES